MKFEAKEFELSRSRRGEKSPPRVKSLVIPRYDSREIADVVAVMVAVMQIKSTKERPGNSCDFVFGNSQMCQCRE